MAPPHPLSWADAPPYHYHGTTRHPAPTKGDGAGAGAAEDGARALWIGGLLHWMNEDYLYCCFTRSPEVHARLRLPSIQSIYLSIPSRD
jgi:hypothetical protein